MRLGTSDLGEPDIELKALYVLQVEGDRVLPGLGLVDVAYPMRCQVDLAILVVWELEFSWEQNVSARTGQESGLARDAEVEHSPLIQSHIVLDEEQVLIGKIRGPQSGRQVDVL